MAIFMLVHQYPEIQEFLQSLQFEKRYSQHTLIAYKTDLEQFAGYLLFEYPNLTLNEIQTSFIRSWLANLKNRNQDGNKEPITNKSINRKISALKSFFKYLLKQGLIKKTPMAGVIAPKISRRLPSFIDEKEIKNIFETSAFTDDYNGQTERLMLTMFYQAGLRLSELINLSESSIDISNSQIKILGKGNKERIVPLSSGVLQAIKDYIAQKKPIIAGENRLFITEKGKAFYPKAVYNLIRNHLIGNNIAVGRKSPHVLRHTFATHLMNHGAEMNAVKELLGHSSLASTQVYTHLTIDKLKEVHKQAHPKA